MSIPPTPVIGILTVSDRAFAREYEDRGGPAISAYLTSHFLPPFTVETAIVPDEQPQIESAIKRLATTCALVLTTGGTGPAPRDVTPEATEACCQRMLPGFGERMRAVSVEKVPTAILSRQTAGICDRCLVVNLPGSPKAIAECLDPVLPAIPHAVRLARGRNTLKLKPEFHPTGRMCQECNVTH
ncbi:unnamed protein product [Chondrus crispus]|uniref:molybdopterin molybdotransferase n=1 Tax=Chondrus crispus TaxID=2769 RepID=R7QHM5_CHOCR|nr:unnamed protein product [Chondrus crispus]CDF37569.1 unnamed protein product [Chondrus crispus]|eukprot:XP_005717440.1 unnamed protein product [Chondrus crispus]